MRYLAKCVQLGMAVLLLSTLAAQAQPPGGGTVMLSPGPTGVPMRAVDTTGINEDVPISIEPICGIVIIVHSASMPYNFYNSASNLWGPPAIIPSADSQGPMWILIFGGSAGPCYTKADFGPRGVVHFGFYTDVPFVTFSTSPCWLIGANQVTVPCTGITGYNLSDHRLHVLNSTAATLDLQNVAVALSATEVTTNQLNRLDLPELQWHSLQLDDNRLRAAEGDQPGTLSLEIPDEFRGKPGYAIFSYEVVDPETRGILSTVTTEVAIPK